MSMAIPSYRSCRAITTLLLAAVWAAPALGQSVVTLKIPAAADCRKRSSTTAARCT